MQDRDAKARAPWGFAASCNSFAFGSGSCWAVLLTVPAGTRLVIERASAIIYTSPSTQTVQMAMQSCAAPCFSVSSLSTTGIQPSTSFTPLTLTVSTTVQKQQVYYEAGSTPILEFREYSGAISYASGVIGGHASASGYTISLP